MCRDRLYIERERKKKREKERELCVCVYTHTHTHAHTLWSIKDEPIIKVHNHVFN